MKTFVYLSAIPKHFLTVRPIGTENLLKSNGGILFPHRLAHVAITAT